MTFEEWAKEDQSRIRADGCCGCNITEEVKLAWDAGGEAAKAQWAEEKKAFLDRIEELRDQLPG